MHCMNILQFFSHYSVMDTWALYNRFFCLFVYLFIFIFGCVGSLLLRASFSLVAASRGYPSLRRAGFSLGGFSCCRARALGARASVVVALGLSSCGSRALECGLQSAGSVVAAQGLNCSAACGIFLDQG